MDIEHQNMDIGFEYFANRCMMPKNDNREDMIMQTANSACIGVAHQSENAFDKKTILEYWCKYFPDLEESQLCEIVEFMGTVDFSNLMNQYQRYDECQDNTLEGCIDFDYSKFIMQQKDWFEQQQMFTGYILPIVNYQYKTQIENYENELIYDRELFWRDIIDNLNLKVYQVLYKSIIFEIGYIKKKNQLKGETPEARMEYFLSTYMTNHENIISFYKEYYAVTKLAASIVKSELKYVTDILDNIKKEKQEIERCFDMGDIAKGIKTIRLGQGDIHQDGKSVVIIEFVNGIKVIYKPHRMEIDLRFEKLMGWLKDNILGLHDYKAPKIITKSGYGFSEYIEYKSCSMVSEVKSFYERIGEILAVLYSLNSSDFHYENIIAHGEYPVLVDLETLIHPSLEDSSNAEERSALKRAEKKYNNSVATIGMLPTYMKGKLEVGGLGAAEVQNSTFKTEFVEDVKRDSIHVVRKYFKIQPEQNNPVLGGRAVESIQYTQEIKRGFQRVYEWILEKKDSYIQFVGELFYGCTGRVIIRPTLYYSQLLNIALHQEFARKKFERQLILHRVAENQYIDFPDVVHAEYLDLMKGNIPYFTYQVGKSDIYDSNGESLEKSKIVPFTTELTGKINEFSKKDLDMQLQYIDNSYLTKRNQADFTHIDWNVYENKLKPNQWLKTAVSIGEYIGENAIEGTNARGKQDLAWICVTLQGFEEDVWLPSVLGHDFYSGNAGIAYYFAYLYKITQKKCFLKSAREAAEIPIMLLDRKYIDKNSMLGAFIGISGSLYMLDSLAQVTGDAELRKTTEDYLFSFEDLIPYDKGNDVISGLAGYLAVALKLAETSKRKREFDVLITRIVDQLLQNAVAEGDHIYWNCMTGKHYCGFSHGNAGIHTYLYLAMQYLGETKWDEIMQNSLNYERFCFDRNTKNWFRSDTERFTSSAWCHGAPGILLSKLMLYNAGYSEKYLLEEMKTALNLTKQLGFGNNPTYCHGDLGNMAILNYAGKTLGDFGLCNQTTHMFQQLYQQTLSSEWRNRNFKSCNTYGLMVGLSGWGYSMLSHYADFDDALPEFLWLS